MFNLEVRNLVKVFKKNSDVKYIVRVYDNKKDFSYDIEIKDNYILSEDEIVALQEYLSKYMIQHIIGSEILNNHFFKKGL